MNYAIVFPGQGSQSVGMLVALGAADADVKATFATASEVLGYDLWALTQDDPDGRLATTAVTQPALLTASVAIWRSWQSRDVAPPAVLAGHSLGEYSALVCAGALDFATAVSLVEQRGQFMQAAVAPGEGAMAAILGLDDDVVIAACADVSDGVVSAVNFNAPGQVVIAGNRASVDAAIDRCKEAGARRALPLPVSVPSHCALMAPAAEQMAERLSSVTLSAPEIPVINNVDVATQSDADAIRDALVRQLYSPVRWVESMRKAGTMGIEAVAECGPGKVLCGLHKRIDRKQTAVPMEQPEDLDALQALISQ